MRNLVFTMVFLFALSSVGLASPLMDYSKGSVGFDYTFRPNLDISGTGEVVGSINPPISSIGNFGFSIAKSFDGDANMDLGLTIGVGNNWAVQYRQYNPQGTIWSNSFNLGPSSNLSVGLDGKIRSEEFNVLYKIAPKASAFIGVVKASAAIKPSLSAAISGSGGMYAIGTDIPEFRTNDKNICQIGLIGSTTFANKFTAYGQVSVGSEYRNWEAGISYGITKDLELNINYRDTKFDKFKFAGASFNPPGGTPYSPSYVDVNLNDVEVKGWGFGITYKF